nr:hypothetical protein [Nostoc sp. CreGUA01]
MWEVWEDGEALILFPHTPSSPSSPSSPHTLPFYRCLSKKNHVTSALKLTKVIADLFKKLLTVATPKAFIV